MATRLVILTGPRAGERHDITGTLLIGRDPDCTLTLPDDKASRRHAQLTQTPTTLTLTDLGSSNGTYIGTTRITQPTTLTGTETITIGDTHLKLEPTPTTTPPPPQTTPPPPRPSVIERIALRQSAGRARILAAAAAAGLVVAIVLVVLFVTGVFAGSEEEQTIADVVEEAKPSTVEVFVVPEGGTPVGAGSGWVWDAEQGLIVTNAHVVNVGPQFSVRLTGDERDRPAEIVGVSPCEDLAVLRVADASGMRTMPLGSQATLRQGDTVIAIGYPATLAEPDTVVVNTGIVSVAQTASQPLFYTDALPDVILSDVKHNPGNSGGPLLDREGNLVGVTTFATIDPGIEAQRYSIGVDRVKEIVPDLAESRSSGWTGLGWYQPASTDELEQLGLPVQDGLVALFTTPGTAAADAGLPTPSLIVAVDGTAITADAADYCTLVGDRQAGDTATFSVIPSGSTDPIDVEVGFS
jgi:S1-C subfamily serine protease